MQTKKKKKIHKTYGAAMVVGGGVWANKCYAICCVLSISLCHRASIRWWCVQCVWTSYWLLASPSLFIQWFLSRQLPYSVSIIIIILFLLFGLFFLFRRLHSTLTLVRATQPFEFANPLCATCDSRRNIFINKYWYYEYRNLQNWNIVINRRNNGILAH